MAEEPGGGGDLRILFWGTPSFALPSLRALGEEGYDVVGVVTQPDRPAGRGRALTSSPVKDLAFEEGFPVLAPDRPWGDDFVRAIRGMEPDLSVVVAYGHILKPEILEIPQGGSINLHASLLPELRGAAPVSWAILRGHSVTGVTVMRMAEAMDAGPILYQIPEDIGASESATELGMRLSEVGAEALVEALALMELGEAEEREQEHDRATFAPKINRDMARIDWDRPAQELGWHLRGMDEVPGAWTLFGGKPLKLFRPDPDPERVHGEVPGTVLEATGSGLLVACGSGVLRVTEIQSPGRRRMAVRDWLRGQKPMEGARFE